MTQQTYSFPAPSVFDTTRPLIPLPDSTSNFNHNTLLRNVSTATLGFAFSLFRLLSLLLSYCIGTHCNRLKPKPLLHLGSALSFSHNGYLLTLHGWS